MLYKEITIVPPCGLHNLNDGNRERKRGEWVMTIKILMLVIFFGVMLAIGFYCRKHATDVNGFVLGENAMKDSELIQKVHSGNKEAVGIIIERYYADIYRFCLYMVQTEDDAYDIAQETFLKFMKYGTSYKHHNLKGYLLTIARNICFNYFRDKKEKVTAIEWEEIDKIPNNKDMLTEAEDAVYLRNLLKELSQDTREVIILRIYEEMKFKDIAKIMGCSVSTTKSRFRLGVNQLKKLLENDYER